MNAPDSPFASRLVQARYYSPSHRSSWSIVVVHDMEAERSTRTAENLGEWWHGPSASHASAHYGVDTDSIVQYVNERDIAWAAGHTANQRGIHIEVQGFARDDAAAWFADQATGRAALLVRDVCDRRCIPMVWLDAAALLRGERGITSHAECSRAWRESDHTDPGAAFPIEAFMGLVRPLGWTPEA